MSKPIFIVDPFTVYLPDLTEHVYYSERLEGHIVRLRKEASGKMMPPVQLVLTTEDTAVIGQRLQEAEALLLRLRKSLLCEEEFDCEKAINDYFKGVRHEQG